MRIHLFLLFFLLSTYALVAQVTKVTGVVYDAETNETLPFTAVRFLGTETGTITDIDGNFQIQSTERVDKIEISFIGYDLKVMDIQYRENQKLNVYLEPSAEQLSEIVLVYKKDRDWVNPAHTLLRNLWDNRDSNDIKRFDSYSCSYYEKIEFDLNNLSREFINRRFLRPFKFAFDYMDTSALSGKNYLPIFLMENQYEVYYKNAGNQQKKQLQAARVSGFDDAANFNELMGSLYQDIDVYQNQIILFEKNFVSPLSRLGLANYRYYLTDSIMDAAGKSYEVRFIPKRKQELTFKGSMWIHDSTFALQSIAMQITDDANLNWVNDLYIQQEFVEKPGIGWVLSKDQIIMDFSVADTRNVKGIYGNKTAYFTSYAVNVPNIEEKLSDVTKDYVEVQLERTTAQWEAIRPAPLTKTEAGIEEMVDSIKAVPAYRVMTVVGAAAFTGYWEFKGWDLGPIPQMFAYNAVEGFRLGMYARSYKTIDDPFRVYGHVNYGFKDDKIKYGAGFKYLVDPDPRLEVGLDYNHDMELWGRGGGGNVSSRYMTLGNSIVSRNVIDEIAYIRAITGYAAFEPIPNLSLRVSAQNRLISPKGALDISYKNPENPSELVNRLYTSELFLQASWTPGRKFFGDGVQRQQLLNNFPTLSISLKQGFKDVLESDFAYKQLLFNVYKPLSLGYLGNAFARLEAGKTFGVVPFPLMNILPGNESFIYARRSFNLMNFGEFVADEHVSLMYEHHFEGLIFNRLPLIRLLKFREVISGKAVIGNMSAESKALLPEPDLVGVPLQGYYEIGGGVENIFKVFRIEAVWRLSYLDRPDVSPFGIFGTFHVRF